MSVSLLLNKAAVPEVHAALPFYNALETRLQTTYVSLVDLCFEAAFAGAISTLHFLICTEGVDVNTQRQDGLTFLMAAAISGKLKTVDFLLDNGADVTIRDGDSCTVIKQALDAGHKSIAQHLVDRFPSLIVTDPRLPKGAAWLKNQFAVVSNNVSDATSKPSPALLERLLSGNLGPVECRNASDVYWEHIFLRFIGDIPLDIERNYSTNLILSLVGTFEAVLKGHEGIKESARLLNSKLPTTQYDIISTVIGPDGGWVTERWGYHDTVNNLQVVGGIDTFLVYEGKIQVKMINYVVEERADPRHIFEKKVGLT